MVTFAYEIIGPEMSQLVWYTALFQLTWFSDWLWIPKLLSSIPSVKLHISSSSYATGSFAWFKLIGSKLMLLDTLWILLSCQWEPDEISKPDSCANSKLRKWHMWTPFQQLPAWFGSPTPPPRKCASANYAMGPASHMHCGFFADRQTGDRLALTALSALPEAH